jgi:hypothetical protein|tara:strand:- start:2648 stop:3955 length:1308 start_codon:yes stop_codon:yes gene_type:complete
MASITNNKQTYGEGHCVVFKTKLSQTLLNELRLLKIVPGTDKFEITLKNYKADKELELSGGGRDTISFLDSKKKVLLVKGKANSINALFNHYSANAKSNTNLLTEIKELFSMEVLRAYTNTRVTLKEDDVIKLVQAQQKETKNNLDEVFYTSAIKQLQVFKTLELKGQFDFERQGGIRTKELYKHARAITGKANDNWNPADVWIINRKCDMSYLLDTRSPAELNEQLAIKVKSKEIIPISLKQVEGPKAKLSVVDPGQMFKQKLDIDFNFSQMDLSDTFANFILSTRSGFQVRGGFKASASTLNVSLEGRYKSAGSQIGGIDAKAYTLKIKDKFAYSLRSTSVSPAQMKIALAEMKEMFGEYGRLSNTIQSFAEIEKILKDKKTTQLQKDRFVNITSYMYSMLILPKNKFKDHMQFCYLTAKKLSDESSIYYLIN